MATYLLGWLGVALYAVNSGPSRMGSTGPEERNHVFSVQAALGQLLSIPAALVMPLLASRWSKSHIYVLGSFGVALSLLPLALIPHWVAAGLGFMGLISLVSIMRPTITVYGQEIVATRWRAAMSGTTSMAAGLGFSAMAFGGGYIITALGYPTLFLAGAGLTATGALIFWSYFCLPRRGSLPGAATDGPE